MLLELAQLFAVLFSLADLDQLPPTAPNNANAAGEQSRNAQQVLKDYLDAEEVTKSCNLCQQHHTNENEPTELEPATASLHAVYALIAAFALTKLHDVEIGPCTNTLMRWTSNVVLLLSDEVASTSASASANCTHDYSQLKQNLTDKLCQFKNDSLRLRIETYAVLRNVHKWSNEQHSFATPCVPVPVPMQMQMQQSHGWNMLKRLSLSYLFEVAIARVKKPWDKYNFLLEKYMTDLCNSKVSGQ